MDLFVNPSGELSLYRQIMRQITDAIAGGRLKPGDKLASHRELSEQLVIAPLTVKKAYDELEALRLHQETQRGRGTFVMRQIASHKSRGSARPAARSRPHGFSRRRISPVCDFPDVETLLKERRPGTDRSRSQIHTRRKGKGMMPILEFTNISRSYKRGVPVLDGVSFFRRAGRSSWPARLRNGAGKTTLLRIAMGMLYPQSGAVRVFGLSPTDRHPVAVKKRVGYVAEDQILPARLKIAELIDFHRYLFPAVE